MVTFELFGIGTDEDVTQFYYVYIRRDADNFYYDEDDGTFKAFASLVDGQVALVEDADQTGLWAVTLDLSVGGEGEYTFMPRDGISDFLVAASVAAFYLTSAGDPLPDNLRDQALIHDATGGVDALQLVEENGDPVEGASVRVYTKADFDANELDTPVGVTATDQYGRWVNPVPVNTGDTYVVHFSKDSEIGPVSQEVIIP
jgi:hypothetical protein